jgi:hypothetical protein
VALAFGNALLFQAVTSPPTQVDMPPRARKIRKTHKVDDPEPEQVAAGSDLDGLRDQLATLTAVVQSVVATQQTVQQAAQQAPQQAPQQQPRIRVQDDLDDLTAHPGDKPRGAPRARSQTPPRQLRASPTPFSAASQQVSIQYPVGCVHTHLTFASAVSACVFPFDVLRLSTGTWMFTHPDGCVVNCACQRAELARA